MKRIKKIALGMVSGAVLTMGMSFAAFAANDSVDAVASFSGKLPAHQSDEEISTVRKATTKAYFTVNMSKIGNSISRVNAWTESRWLGINYSNPFQQIGMASTDIDYDTVPDVGDDVVLNMDNPADVDYEISVAGQWTPR